MSTTRDTDPSKPAARPPGTARGVSRRDFALSLLAAPLSLAPTQRVTARSPDRARAHRRERAVVVGAGAFGGWTALSLLRAGYAVTLVDAWGAGNSRASSGGETRVIRAVYGGVRTYTEMVARALTLWREAEQRWQQQVLFRSGALWMFAGDDGYARRSMEPLRAAGIPLREMAPDEAARRYPQMAFADVRTVFLEPEAGYLAARVACELVRESFVKEGGDYRQSLVRAPADRGARLTSVSLSDGSILEAERFVFACGAWLPQLFPRVIGRRVVPTRQEVFFFGAPAGDARYDFRSLPAWVHMGERVVYGVPAHDRRGLKIADDSAGSTVDPETLDRVPTVEGLARARAILGERFPALRGAPLLEARVCQYEASSDGNFIVDRHPELDNVWLVGGGSGHGFKMGPALGEHVAALVQGHATVNPLFVYARLRPVPPGMEPDGSLTSPTAGAAIGR